MKKPWMATMATMGTMAVTAATAIAVVTAVLWTPRDPGRPAPAIRDSAAELVDTRPQSADAAAPASNKALPEVAPAIDPARLFDKAYENDAYVRAVASQAGISPACVIAELKYAFHQVPLEEGVCPSPGAAEDSPGFAVSTGHPYTQYSNRELESLATSDAEAAVILARRTESDAEARAWYERAVALSGIGEPLIEWMYDRETGGLSKVNGVLDVEAAKQGYKTHLVVAAIDGFEDPILETYQQELQQVGVDLAEIETAAAQEVADLRRERETLTGGERP